MMNGPAFERGFFLGRHGYKPSDQEKNILSKILILTFKSGANKKWFGFSLHIISANPLNASRLKPISNALVTPTKTEDY